MNTVGYPEPLITKLNPNERIWCLKEEFCYTVEWASGYRCEIIIPANFRFDMASVPRIFWTFLSHTDLSIAAPLVHDWLYVHKGRPPGDCILSRFQADNLFAEMMAERGVVWWRAKLAHWAVKRYGTWGSQEDF